MKTTLQFRLLALRMSNPTYVPGVALITGAASGTPLHSVSGLLPVTSIASLTRGHMTGIGRATAQAFVNAGCMNLALLDINQVGLETTQQIILDSCGKRVESKLPKIEIISCDVTSAPSIVAAYAKVKTSFGRLDYSVHCAGVISFEGRSTEASIEGFDRTNSINYRGVWLCAREALKIMKDQPLDCEVYPNINPIRAQRGAIVNISSGLAVVSQLGSNVYSGSKAGVMGITRSDAIDYVTDRIRVNAVLPGIVDTPITSPTPEVRAFIEAGPVQRTPMKRLGLAEELADVIVFLASTQASFVTGSCWNADGGFLAC